MKIQPARSFVVLSALADRAHECRGMIGRLVYHRPGSAMFTPHSYSLALILMTLSMLCWGTWANTQKITRQWPFELYYFDYTIGLVLCSVLFGLTLGQVDPALPDSFLLNLRAASERSVWLGFAGGAVFNCAVAGYQIERLWAVRPVLGKIVLDFSKLLVR
jgi:hypothetical protein